MSRKVFTNSFIDKQILLSINLLLPQNYHHIKDFNYGTKYNDSTELQKNIEPEVVDCGKKSVFVSHENLVEEEFRFLSKQYAGKKFYRGRDIMGGSCLVNGLVFSLKGKRSRLLRYFWYLVDTGVYGRIEKELGDRRLLFRRPALAVGKENDIVVPLSLGGAIVTVFILSGLLILLAGVVFMIENKLRIGKFLRRILAEIYLCLDRSKHLYAKSRKHRM